MADQEPKKSVSREAPPFDPKPVNVGGESLVDRIYPHRMKLGLIALSGIVIWAVIAVVVHFRDADRESATEKLGRVLEVGKREIRAPEAKTDSADPKAVRKTEANTFPDSIQRANAMLSEQGVDTAGPTFRASLLVQAGKLAEAIEEFRKAQGKRGVDGVLAREGLGLAQEMSATQKSDAAERQKGLEDALATFQAMQPDEKGPRRAFALYHQGRILELLGKPNDAKAMLEKAKQVEDAGELAHWIEARLVGLGT